MSTGAKVGICQIWDHGESAIVPQHMGDAGL